MGAQFALSPSRMAWPLDDISRADLAAATFFLACWVGYRWLLRASAGGAPVTNEDMNLVRRAWMHTMMRRREQRLIDGQLIGHALSSAGFFASSNLILIAAAAGVLFGGQTAYAKALQTPLLAHAPRLLFQLKMALVIATLARGLSDFIWAIRQLNYYLAILGASPDGLERRLRDRYADAAAVVLNAAFNAFSSGVRGYYFALAAACWLAGPAALAAGVIAVLLLLVWRQRFSPAAKGVRAAREILTEALAERGNAPAPPGPLGDADGGGPAAGVR